MVEYNVANVDVAGSSPVIHSRAVEIRLPVPSGILLPHFKNGYLTHKKGNNRIAL
jgi:hypothetical protein